MLEDVKVTVKRETPWSLAYDRALETEHKEPKGVEPTSAWKVKMLKCEHSPIRCVMYTIRFENLPYWVSVHLVRHKFGAEHFVSTQRVDRTGEERDGKRQDAPVNHSIFLNAQEIMNISRRRLCSTASPETRAAWGMVVSELRKIGEGELADACVPMCIYRGGHCSELHPCGMLVNKHL